MSRIASFFRIFWMALPLFIALSASSQKKAVSTATWIMPGASLQMSSKLRLFAQFGYNEKQRMTYIYTQGFFSLSKHIIVSAGHSFLNSNGLNSFRQHDIIAAAAFSRTFGKLTLEDRNMFRVIMISNSPSAYVYRNRIRASYPFSFLSQKGSAYVMDEGFYSLNNGLWSRNRAGLGITYDILKKVNLDVAYLQQDDAFIGRSNLIFLQLTANLSVKKSK